jgi:hypothetical protein
MEDAIAAVRSRDREQGFVVTGQDSAESISVDSAEHQDRLKPS